MAKINDGLVSLATSLGQRTASRKYTSDRRLSTAEVENLYYGNWIIQKYIDTRAKDMTRLDREISSDNVDRIEAMTKRFKLRMHKQDALVWASVYGECIVVAITQEGDLTKPLDLDVEQVKRFIVIDKTGYTAQTNLGIEQDITNANFGKARLYQVGDLQIHNSRLHHIEASRKSFKQLRNGGYARSDIQAIYQPLVSYLSTALNISDIVDQSKTDVLKIEGFNAAIAAGREDVFAEAARAMKSIRSSTDALFIDATAEYEQKEMTFTGLVEILKSQRDDLAGACSMPLTRLFGQSASGFASGEEDNQNYYEVIASLQESRLRPLDEFFDRVLHPDTVIDFEYPSIELSNAVEQSTVLSATVSALSTTLADGVITEAEYATELRNNNLVSSITSESIAYLKEMINETNASASIEAEQGSRALLSRTA